MAIQRRMFGEHLVTSIMDVEGELAFGDLFEDEAPPPVSTEQLSSAYPDEYSSTGWRFLCRCFLVQGPDATILVDLGIGPAGSPASAWISTPGRLMDELNAMDVSPESVDHVVITHHHDDHTGWATIEREGEWAPRFANAVYHMHLADLLPLKNGKEPEALDLYRSVFEPLERTDQLLATETEDELTPSLRLVNTPGHTPGHRCVALSLSGQEVLIVGDLLHFTHQLGDADWKSPLDEDPSQAIRTRADRLARAQKDGAVIASTHLPYDFCQVVEGPDGRTLEER